MSIKKGGIDFTFLDLLYQNTRNIAIAILCLFILGKIINKRTRFIDIVNVVLISRIAYYIVFITDFIPIINNKLDKVTTGVMSNNLAVLQESSTMIVIVIVAFIAIFYLCDVLLPLHRLQNCNKSQDHSTNFCIYRNHFIYNYINHNFNTINTTNYMRKLLLTTFCTVGSLLFAQELNKPALDSLFTYMNKRKNWCRKRFNF